MNEAGLHWCFCGGVSAKKDVIRLRVAHEVIDAKDTAEPQISKSA